MRTPHIPRVVAAALVMTSAMAAGVSTVAQETESPQRSIPIGIIGSLIVCTVLYVLMAAVLTGLIPYPLLNRPEPIAAGIDAFLDGLDAIIEKKSRPRLAYDG